MNFCFPNSSLSVKVCTIHSCDALRFSPSVCKTYSHIGVNTWSCIPFLILNYRTGNLGRTIGNTRASDSADFELKYLPFLQLKCNLWRRRAKKSIDYFQLAVVSNNCNSLVLNIAWCIGVILIPNDRLSDLSQAVRLNLSLQFVTL